MSNGNIPNEQFDDLCFTEYLLSESGPPLNGAFAKMHVIITALFILSLEQLRNHSNALNLGRILGVYQLYFSARN